MKNFGKALKLYLKVSFNPLLTLFGAVIIVGIMIAAVHEPEVPESDEYMSMISAVSFGQIGILIFFLIGSTSAVRSKFFASLPCSKLLFTVVPTAVTAALTLIYNSIVIAVAALCWEEQALADILIAAPVNSFIICLAVSVLGKPGLEALYAIPVLILATEQLVLPNISATKHGFGLPLIPSAVIGVMIFAAGTAAVLAVLNIWWRRCDHIRCSDYNYTPLNR